MGTQINIKMIAFDVDGTLTNGKLYENENGELYKQFHVHDGLMLSLAHSIGIKTGLITGRNSPIVKARGKELGMDFVLLGVKNKVKAMEELKSKYNLSWEEIAYMGDDLNDLNLLEKVAFSGCPKNAREENKKICDFISEYEGGNGAAREFIEKILKAQNLWETALNKFKEITEE